ncbi:type II secretion system protein [Photobacterium kagoshimensis]|uniref:type II secretion system protein n=1 Tax=Photobacterium kagoshimensis TaxID=2910242 RepID=UPI003D0BAF4B
MKNKGFTLIELVVVIVILGILAVTAAPRFMNMQVDARNSALQAMKGAMTSGMEMGYGILAMNGLEATPLLNKDVPVAGCEKTSCDFRYGYPAADTLTLPVLVDALGDHTKRDDWAIVFIHGQDDLQGPSITITQRDNVYREGQQSKLVNNNCFIRYYRKTQNDIPYRLEITPCQ